MIYTLPHIITQSADRYPNKVAFSCLGNTRTYAQLSDEVNQVANVLVELGVQKGDRVGVYLNRSIETPIAIFGIMKAGAIYVPMDTNAPVALTNFLIEDCGISIIISHPSQRRKLAVLVEEKTQLQTIIGWNGDQNVDVLPWESVRERSVGFNPAFQLLEQDPAYIIYTSGSTGKPKGIVHTHYSGLAYARLSVDSFGIQAEDRLANHAPVFFDISLLGYFAGPLVGASTIIIADAYTIMPASLSSLIEKEKISIWYSVPLALTQMLQSGTLQDVDASSLRWVMYAGEPFPPKYLKPLMQLWPNVSFCNKYGPAETNVCTYYNINEALDTDQAIPIGRVWGNTDMLITDDKLQSVKSGEEGELLIRSATTMLGYWGNPELTNKVFHDVKAKHGFIERYYRTGDLVKEDKNGILHFIGRKDHQIKTRGYRVELGAVESEIVGHPHIAEAIVFSIKENDETVSISSAVVINQDSELSEQEIIEYLKQSLPFYAVPTKVNILQDFPRTGSGKINRPSIIAQLTKKQ